MQFRLWNYMQFKRWQWGIFLSGALFATLLLAKNDVSRYLINLYLHSSAYSVTCLSWSLNGFSRLEVEYLCIEGGAFTFNMKDINVSTTQLHVKNLQIEHRQIQRSSPYIPQALNMPLVRNRPLLVIDKVLLSTPYFGKPIELRLVEKELSEFEISGDLQASLKVSESMVKMQAHLISPLLKAYLFPQVKALSGVITGRYNGLTLELDIRSRLQSLFNYNQCVVDLALLADSSIKTDLRSLVSEILVTELELKTSSTHCKTSLPKALNDHVVKLLNAVWRAEVSQPIELSKSHLVLPQIQVVNNRADRAKMTELMIDWSGTETKAQFVLQHHSSELGLFEYGGGVAMSNNGIISAQGQLNHQAEKLLMAGLQLESSNLQAEFAVEAAVATQTFLVEAQGNFQSHQLAYDSVVLKEVNAPFKIFGDISSQDTDLAGKVDLESRAIQLKETVILGVSSEAEIKVDHAKKVDVALVTSLDKILNREIVLEGITQSLDMVSDLRLGAGKAHFDAQTNIAKGHVLEYSVPKLSINTTGDFDRTLSLSHRVNQSDFALFIEHEMLSENHPFSVLVNKQALRSIQPFIQKWLPELKLTQGFLNGKMVGDIDTKRAHFSGQLIDAALLYDNHYLEGINTDMSGNINSGMININDSKLIIDQVRSGAVLSDLTVHYTAKNSDIVLSNLRANTFGGEIHVPRLNVQTDTYFTLALNKLDLEMLSVVGRDVGIMLSGNISGELPIFVSDTSVSIEKGKLFNEGRGFLIVQNNATIDALKAEQPSLEAVIGLLDHLTIDELTSDVTLSEDGWIILGVKIAGVNEPQAQPVNFNYTHSENIFTLFEALRWSDTVTQKVKQKMTK